MSDKRTAVLALGFRPFYLLASGWAIFAIFEWLLELQGIGLRAFNFLSGMQWHAHEMIFGFAATVVRIRAYRCTCLDGLRYAQRAGITYAGVVVDISQGRSIYRFIFAYFRYFLFTCYCNCDWAINIAGKDVSQSFLTNDFDALGTVKSILLSDSPGVYQS